MNEYRQCKNRRKKNNFKTDTSKNSGVGVDRDSK